MCKNFYTYIGTVSFLFASLSICAFAGQQDKKDQASNAIDVALPGEFPAAGHSYKADFGQYKFTLNFKSNTELSFLSADGKSSETVTIEATKLRKNLFMVAWQEKAGYKVAQIEDFEKEQVYTNIAGPKGEFLRMKGSLKREK